MRRFLMTSTVLFACGATPAAALAQGQPASAEQGAEADTTIGLRDIIVTAQRRVESAQRAAVAIDVVGGSDLVGSGVTQASNLGTVVPALTIQQVGPANAAFIRGVGNFSVVVTNDSAVAFNYDGVYLGRINATSGTFFDLDRVEVLKGPQGTLYGRNATAGVINILPTQPKLGEFSGYGTLTVGNYDLVIAEAAANVPVGDQSALRVSGIVTHRDGYLRDGTSDDRTQALRVQFKAEPAPGLTIRLAGDYTHLGGIGQGFSYISRYNATTVTPSGVPLADGMLTPAAQAFYRSLGAGQAGQVRSTRDAFPRPFQNSNFYGINGEITWDTGSGVLTVIPAARWNRLRTLSGAGGFPVNQRQHDRQYSTEARFSGKAGMFDYTLGAFYFNENVELYQSTLTFGSNISFFTPTTQKTESYAPFARLTANLTPQLRLVGGVRYTHDKRKLNSTNVALAFNCAVPFTCANAILPVSTLTPGDQPFPIPTANGQTIPGPAAGTTITRTEVSFRDTASYSKTTWRGAVEFDIAPASLLYASVETGFRSGGFNTSVGFERFEPEYLTAYTLGSKNRFFDNRVQLNLEAFYWRYRNQQVAHPGFDKGIPPRANSITENIGRSTIKGFEVDARVMATETTLLSGSVQYLDTVNKQFTYISSSLLQARTGCATAPVTPPTTPPTTSVNCAGFPAFAAPKWTVNLGAEQTIPMGAYKLVVGADTQYKTERYLGFEYQPEQLQPSSWTSNAQISFGPSDDSWSLSAFVRNIENDRLLVAPIAFAGVLVAYTTPPRTFGIRGTAKF
ncbi:TonB-dependent receptor [Sphingobium jiangsuense]|uniref:Iron complex outermembrane receptor protein n=1 Tax=Sphingobium jiangsuense TaxID=870476 RepID=A0A7W6BR38_9SPHN|nr:TonB-dependent receptor [Sphingobium jiangsuense]MBB3928252.1 iron complex outermembrane receptor protein [Sphingobium jiangsuense]GLS99372.1 TonB-dependent receptor [Sphingobium jiangsuense]